MYYVTILGKEHGYSKYICSCVIWLNLTEFLKSCRTT